MKWTFKARKDGAAIRVGQPDRGAKSAVNVRGYLPIVGRDSPLVHAVIRPERHEALARFREAVSGWSC
jgi:hypothetical protein